MYVFDWHGYAPYPIGMAIHADRPWWRATGSGWWRNDNSYLLFPSKDEVGGEDAALIAYDRERPMTAPPPLCNQVWIEVRGDFLYHRCIVGLLIYGKGRHHRISWGDGTTRDVELKDWPPPGWSLVSGPGAPWAPAAAGKENLTP